MSESEVSTTGNRPTQFSRRRHWAAEQAISFLMQQGVENPDVISLAAGFVDAETLPVDAVHQAIEHLFADERNARQALQYGTTAGASSLREQLIDYVAGCEHCAAADLGIDASQLILTTGSQQLLSLVGEVLFDPEDICLVAAPTYFVFLGTLNGLGARPITVPTDAGGMRMDALDAQLAQLDRDGQLPRVKMIYLVSYYANPSGLSLAKERRAQAIEIANRWSKHHQIFILEDVAYRELRYDGPDLTSVWRHDEGRETVILAQTFSKSFSPGLRIGFAIAPQSLVAPLCDRKGNEDFGSANFNQHVLATVLREGLYESHVEALRASYRRKRDCMLAAADRYCKFPGVTWIHPHGGLYVWMSLPGSVDCRFTGRLFKRATQVEKVMYVPGDLCFAGAAADRPRNHLRLSFGVQSLEGIDEGMRRLAQAIETVL